MTRAEPPFSGVLVALVTPLDDDGRLDERALEGIVARAVAEGVSGVCPVGSTGEGPRLPRDVRSRTISLTRAMTEARRPVIAAVIVNDMSQARRELEELAASGIDASLVSPPSYFPLGAAAVETFFTELAEVSPVPLLIYNIPQLTRVEISPAVVGRLAEVPGICGIKDSSRDMEYFTGVLAAVRESPAFGVLTGTDTLLLPSLLLGGHGTIAASANFAPQLAISVYEATREGDLPRAREQQLRLFRLVQTCRVGDFPAGWKAALHGLGLCSERLAPPALPLATAQRDQLWTRLRELDFLDG